MIMFICVKRDKSPQNFRQTTNRAHLCYIVIHKVVGKLFNCDYFFKVLILICGPSNSLHGWGTAYRLLKTEKIALIKQTKDYHLCK